MINASAQKTKHGKSSSSLFKRAFVVLIAVVCIAQRRLLFDGSVSNRVIDETAPEVKESNINHKITKKAFVHIGPHKTGTSALQQALLVDYEQQMKMDGFVFPTQSDLPGRFDGPKAHANLATCLLKHETCSPNTCHPLLWNETLPAFMQRARSEENGPKVKPKSMLLSAELLSTACVDKERLHHLLSGFRTIILAVYRPLYEWIISDFSQTNKYSYPAKSIVDEIQQPHFFDHVDQRFSTLVGSYLRSDTSEDSLFDEAVVLDYLEVRNHEAGLPAVVACDILNARHTCKGIMDDIAAATKTNGDSRSSSPVTNVNIYEAIDYQRIVEAAWNQGLFGSNDGTNVRDTFERFQRYSMQESGKQADLPKEKEKLMDFRRRKARKLQAWWEGDKAKSLLDLPHACIDKAILDKIEEVSWKYYLRMRPYIRRSPADEGKSLEELRQQMSSMVQSSHHKYCSVDAKMVIEDQEWRRILLA